MYVCSKSFPIVMLSVGTAFTPNKHLIADSQGYSSISNIKKNNDTNVIAWKDKKMFQGHLILYSHEYHNLHTTIYKGKSNQ